MVISFPEYSLDKPLPDVRIALTGGLDGITETMQGWQGKLIGDLSSFVGIDINNPSFAILNPWYHPYSYPFTQERVNAWQYEHIERSNIVAFWFDHDTSPSTLVYYGQMLERARRYQIFVLCGFDEGYTHKTDVENIARMHLRDMEFSESGRTFYLKKLPYSMRVFISQGWNPFVFVVKSVIESAINPPLDSEQDNFSVEEM
jgi:hypothetical protein